jgi:hypothetical protein
LRYRTNARNLIYKLLRNISIVAFISFVLAVLVQSWLHYTNETDEQMAMGVLK